MTEDDRKFLSVLANCLKNADRIRIKGDNLPDMKYVIFSDAQATELSKFIENLVERDKYLNEAKSQMEEYRSHSLLN